jgi:outer membrane protein OmpA-like peptidoglycan-associated protein
MLSGLYQSVWAAMISTESIINLDRALSSREYLNNLLAREEIQAALLSQGIDPQEAQSRIDNLSDEKIGKFVHEMEQLPAGGGVLETFFVIVFLIFLVLLATDISGYTDVFPFVKKKVSRKTTREETTLTTANINKTQPSLEDNGINPSDNLIIYFNPDTNDLATKEFVRLDRVAKFVAKNSKTRINIKGFSDSTGSSSYDQMVSESRANIVKSYLIAKGVDPTKISTLGMGSQALPVTSDTEEKGQMIGGALIEFNTPGTK